MCGGTVCNELTKKVSKIMGADKPAAEEKVGTMMNEVMEYPIQYCAAPHDEKKTVGILQTTIH